MYNINNYWSLMLPTKIYNSSKNKYYLFFPIFYDLKYYKM